jgi:hypothetical protein
MEDLDAAAEQGTLQAVVVVADILEVVAVLRQVQVLVAAVVGRIQ